MTNPYPPGTWPVDTASPYAELIDYVPPWLPGTRLTLTATNAVSGGDLLEVTGDGTVGTCTDAATAKYVGVAGQTITWPGPGQVLVYGRGPVHESVCDGVVTAGQQLVTSATPGRQVAPAAAPSSPPTQADENTTRAIIGVALTSAPDGVKCRWMQT